MEELEIVDEVKSIDELDKSAAAKLVEFGERAGFLREPIDVSLEEIETQRVVEADVVELDSIGAVWPHRLDDASLVIAPVDAIVRVEVDGERVGRVELARDQGCYLTAAQTRRHDRATRARVYPVELADERIGLYGAHVIRDVLFGDERLRVAAVRLGHSNRVALHVVDILAEPIDRQRRDR